MPTSMDAVPRRTLGGGDDDDNDDDGGGGGMGSEMSKQQRFQWRIVRARALHTKAISVLLESNAKQR